MGSKHSKPYECRSDTVTCEAQWRKAFIADLRSSLLADSKSHPLLPTVLSDIIASYHVHCFDDMLQAVGWIQKSTLALIPRAVNPSGFDYYSPHYTFDWNRHPLPRDVWDTPNGLRSTRVD